MGKENFGQVDLRNDEDTDFGIRNIQVVAETQD